MRITVTHDDGTERDVTDLVAHAYQLLWEGTNWHKDWYAEDADKLAQLAAAIRHPHAATAREVADAIRQQERTEAEAEEQWHREHGAGAGMWKP